jgi:hypothetical protein
MTPRCDELATVQPARALTSGTVVEVDAMVVLAPINRGDEALSTTAETHAATEAATMFLVRRSLLRRMVLVDRTPNSNA